MSIRQLQQELSRREFLRVAASIGAAGAGAVLLGACGSDDGGGSAPSTPAIVADPPPETTTIRLPKADTTSLNDAALSLARQFLPAEGFTDVQYVDRNPTNPELTHVTTGEIDFDLAFPSSMLVAAEAGDQIVALAGVMNSPWELYGNERVQSLRDLKGTRIFVPRRHATDSVYALWAVLLAYVGIDIERDVEFVELSVEEFVQQLVAGGIDAWLGARPVGKSLGDAGFGQVFLDGRSDPPWSQYLGPMAVGNRKFVATHPVATKRALRAILKGADVCAREPERSAHYLVDTGITPWPYEAVLDAITGVSFAAWREFNPEDTMRFYALRLKEAGLVKSTPDELIARATDWRYLDEIKRELGVA